MKINYLKLNNIGPYVGTHVFNLNTNSNKNIILIGGKNGAGKTTFLKAIKFGLFGSFSLGLKTDTDKYFYEIKSLINNKAKNDFYIEISFDYIENFEVKKYTIKRKWNYFKNDLKEEVEVIFNDETLGNYESKEILDKLRAMTSPQLINSFIFDGEKISSIIENGEISSYLEETFNSIFSIDLIKQTKKDVETYLSKKANESNMKEQIDNVSMIAKISSLKNEVKTLENELSQNEEMLSNFNSIKKSNVENFYKLGGLTKNEQEKLSEKMNALNKEKEEMNNKIRAYIESELPLYLCSDLIIETINQCKKEQTGKYLETISKIEILLNISLPDVKEKLIEACDNCKIIHDVSDENINYLSSRFNEAIEKNKVLKPYIDSKIARMDEYRLIKKSLIANENIETFDKLIEENKKIDISIKNLENIILSNQQKISLLKKELEVSFSVYEKMNEEIKKSSLYDSSFVLGKDVLDLCDKYENSIKKIKISKVSDIALNIFNDTIRKNDFITELSIDENFNLRLKNSSGTIVDPKTLSAGEMQILVSSLIWAMFRISGRREMFIFDTPLARLDKENRLNFVTKIISTMSSQVIILSTDSEFVGKNLSAIQPIIFKKYLLEYSTKNNATTISDNYFGE